MRWWLWILLVLVVLIVAVSGYFFYLTRNLQAEAVAEDVWVLFGLGGNVTVIRTGEGAVLVDSMTFRATGKRIRRMAEQLTGEPVRMVINTHYHLDHTHGNPAFAEDTRIVSTQRTLEYLQHLDADYFSGGTGLPNDTFEGEHYRLEVGDKSLLLLYPGRGHTDGDLVVLLEDEGIVNMGDLHFNRYYPNIDLEAGGSVQQWGQSLARVLEMDFEVVVPGHGEVTDREGLQDYQRFIRNLAEVGRTAKANKQSLEEVLENNNLTADQGFTPLIPLLGPDREFVLTRAWEEVMDPPEPAY